MFDLSMFYYKCVRLVQGQYVCIFNAQGMWVLSYGEYFKATGINEYNKTFTIQLYVVGMLC